VTRPTVSITAERLYEALGPMQDQDDTHGWALLHLCDALTATAAEIEDLAADTDTRVGWQPLLDVILAPPKVLPYLGMFAGAVVTPGLTVDQQRALIRSAPGQRRGTVQAVKDAARLWLTGAQTVTVTERAGGDAYAVRVTVYEAEVVDTAQLTAAVQASIPAGLSLDLIISEGWTYDALEARYTADTYDDVETIWAGLTYTEFERELP